MNESSDAIWRALADPTRRALLDHLRAGPRTTGDLCGRFPELSRYAVMKHLGILEEARLVLVERHGRERHNFLNPVPIREIYERWISRFTESPAILMTSIKHHIENDAKEDNSP